jgi:hypothetical protein
MKIPLTPNSLLQKSCSQPTVKFPFELHNPNDKRGSYLLSASSHDKLKMWLVGLQDAIDCLHRNHAEGRAPIPKL